VRETEDGHWWRLEVEGFFTTKDTKDTKGFKGDGGRKTEDGGWRTEDGEWKTGEGETRRGGLVSIGHVLEGVGGGDETGEGSAPVAVVEEGAEGGGDEQVIVEDFAGDGVAGSGENSPTD
jgi:hypothetical protein